MTIANNLKHIQERIAARPAEGVKSLFASLGERMVKPSETPPAATRYSPACTRRDCRSKGEAALLPMPERASVLSGEVAAFGHPQLRIGDIDLEPAAVELDVWGEPARVAADDGAGRHLLPSEENISFPQRPGGQQSYSRINNFQFISLPIFFRRLF